MWVLYPLSFNSVGNIVKPVERFREIRDQVISIDSYCQANRKLAPVGTPPARRGFKARCWRPRWKGYLSRRSFFSYLAVYVGLTSSTVFAFFASRDGLTFYPNQYFCSLKWLRYVWTPPLRMIAQHSLRFTCQLEVLLCLEYIPGVVKRLIVVLARIALALSYWKLKIIL